MKATILRLKKVHLVEKNFGLIQIIYFQFILAAFIHFLANSYVLNMQISLKFINAPKVNAKTLFKNEFKYANILFIAF